MSTSIKFTEEITGLFTYCFKLLRLPCVSITHCVVYTLTVLQHQLRPMISYFALCCGLGSDWKMFHVQTQCFIHDKYALLLADRMRRLPR